LPSSIQEEFPKGETLVPKKFSSKTRAGISQKLKENAIMKKELREAEKKQKEDHDDSYRQVFPHPE
jgi:hypothetical protein